MRSLILYKMGVCAYNLFADVHSFCVSLFLSLSPPSHSTSFNAFMYFAMAAFFLSRISSTIHLILDFFGLLLNALLTSTPEMRSIYFTVNCTSGFHNKIDCLKLGKKLSTTYTQTIYVYCCRFRLCPLVPIHASAGYPIRIGSMVALF